MSAVQNPWRWCTGSQRTRSAGIANLLIAASSSGAAAGNFAISSATGFARLRIFASAVSYGAKNFGR